MAMKGEYTQYEGTTESIRSALERWKKANSRSRCDKKGFGVNLDSRFSGAKVQLSFDSWTGERGHSGCSTFFHPRDDKLFAEAFIYVLNHRFCELLEATAERLEEVSESLRLGEIARLEARLAKLQGAANHDNSN